MTREQKSSILGLLAFLFLLIFAIYLVFVLHQKHQHIVRNYAYSGNILVIDIPAGVSVQVTSNIINEQSKIGYHLISANNINTDQSIQLIFEKK